MASVSIVSAAQGLSAAPVHIIVCDTCALLDIIRLPIRASTSTHLSATLSAVDAVVSMIQTGDVRLVCPSPVPDEWTKHAADKQAETERHIRNIEQEYGKVRSTAAAQGTSMPSAMFPRSQIAAYLYDKSNTLLSSSIVLQKEEEPSLRAIDRASSYIAPASKGAIKDCLIYEHMIALFDALSNGVPIGRRVLLTSNTKDFCAPNSSRPKPPLDAELSARGVVLCTSWDWALAEIRLSTTVPPTVP